MVGKKSHKAEKRGSRIVPKTFVVFRTLVSSGFANARRVLQMHDGFCKCTKTVLTEAETQTRDRCVTAKSTNFCTKKWYIQGELSGLTKKENN